MPDLAFVPLLAAGAVGILRLRNSLALVPASQLRPA